MKSQKSKTWGLVGLFGVGIFALGSLGIVKADISQTLRAVVNGFEDLDYDQKDKEKGMINQVCGASLGYYLPDKNLLKDDEEFLLESELVWNSRLDGAKNRFEQRINCVVNDAFGLGVEQTNSQMLTILKEETENGEIPGLLRSDLWADNKNLCEGQSLAEIADAQRGEKDNSGAFKNLCPESENSASPCVVADVLLTELCGYVLHMSLTALDEQGTRDLYDELQNAENLGANQSASTFNPETDGDACPWWEESNFSSALAKRQSCVLAEKAIAQKAVEQTLSFYKEFYDEYQKFAEDKLKIEITKKLKNEVEAFGGQLKKFQNQADYSSAENCS